MFISIHAWTFAKGSKPIVVKFAEGYRQRMEYKLSVGNLPAEADEAQITQLFAQVCNTGGSGVTVCNTGGSEVKGSGSSLIVVHTPRICML